jgi:hypothetical protein
MSKLSALNLTMAAIMLMATPLAKALPGSNHVFPAVNTGIQTSAGTPLTQTLTSDVIKDSYGDPVSGVLSANFTLSASFPSPINVGGVDISPGQTKALTIDFTASGGKLNLPIHLPSGGTVGTGDYTITFKTLGMVKWTAATSIPMSNLVMPDGTVVTSTAETLGGPSTVCKFAADLQSAYWCKTFPQGAASFTSDGSDVYVSSYTNLVKLNSSGTVVWAIGTNTLQRSMTLWKGSVYGNGGYGTITRFEPDGKIVLLTTINRGGAEPSNDWGFATAPLVLNDKLVVWLSNPRMAVLNNEIAGPTGSVFSSTVTFHDDPAIPLKEVNQLRMVSGRPIALSKAGLIEMNPDNLSASKTLHTYCPTVGPNSHQWTMPPVGSTLDTGAALVEDQSGHFFLFLKCSTGGNSYIVKVRKSNFTIADYTKMNQAELGVAAGGQLLAPVKVLGNELVVTTHNSKTVPKLIGIDLQRVWRKPATDQLVYQSSTLAASTAPLTTATLNNYSDPYIARGSAYNPLPGVTYNNAGGAPVTVTLTNATAVIGPKIMAE